MWSNPYQIKNLPVPTTSKGAADYLYRGIPIYVLKYISHIPYRELTEKADSITEYLGTYQMIENYFPQK